MIAAVPAATPRLGVVAALACLAALVLLVPAPSARAHSGLTDASVPGPSQTVDERLDEVRLVFEDPIEADPGNAIELSTIDDRFVELGPVEVTDDGTALRAEISGTFPAAGEYLILYTVASTDGDGLQEGGFTFTYEGPVAGGVRPAWLVTGAVVLVLLAGAVALRRRA
jgi:methionine-rich copper-binding protein CopC